MSKETLFAIKIIVSKYPINIQSAVKHMLIDFALDYFKEEGIMPNYEKLYEKAYYFSGNFLI